MASGSLFSARTILASNTVAEHIRKHSEAHEMHRTIPAKMRIPEGLVGVAKRFVAFNGGIGQLQLGNKERYDF
jgi:hypothetical protein